MQTTFSYRKGYKFILVLTTITALLISQGFAQKDKVAGTPKKEQKTVHIKVITKDDNGNVTEIDTVYQSGDSHDSVFGKRFGKKFDTVELEKMLKNMDITLNFSTDSLDSLSKDISAMINMNSWPKPGDFENFNFNWNEDDSDPELLPDRNYDEWNPSMNGNGKMFVIPRQPDPPGWNQGYTPWGKIREIKIKDKKRGKKIVIRTEDADNYGFFPMPPVPPVPPVPPAHARHPKMQKGSKKIIIEKDKDVK